MASQAGDTPETSAVSLPGVESQDHADGIVPSGERRGPVTLALLWVTMVTGFPSVLAGFDWYKHGLVFEQIVICLALSCVVLLAYTIPACYLGAQSGQTFSLLSRSVFGQWGSRIVSFNLVVLSMAWYGLTAFMMAEALVGLFHLTINIALLSAILGVLMAFNNFFGFSGIANFAGYIAAPVMILWVGYTFLKVSHTITPALFVEQSHQGFGVALPLVSAFVLGYGSWGNEADFWRYSQAKGKLIAIPLIVAILIGQILFPITGFLIAHMTKITAFADATAFMNGYSFFGMAPVACLVLFVTYFALADSCLYGSINGTKNLHRLPRKVVVGVLTALGAMIAAWLSGVGHAFEDVAALSSIILPCASVIIIAEAYVVPKLALPAISFARVYDFSELPAINWSAMIAFVMGSLVGIATCGIISDLECIHVGISGLQAWLVSFILYIVLRRCGPNLPIPKATR